MDAVKGRCSRSPCRYFHPPLHLQAQIKAAQSRAVIAIFTRKQNKSSNFGWTFTFFTLSSLNNVFEIRSNAELKSLFGKISQIIFFYNSLDLASKKVPQFCTSSYSMIFNLIIILSPSFSLLCLTSPLT